MPTHSQDLLIAEPYKGLLVRSDGMVKNINVSTKDWGCGYSNGSGRLHVVIPNTNKKIKVHQLVAQAFIPNPFNHKYVNHKNCNPSDNRVENLEWVTHRENMQRMLTHIQGRLFGTVYLKDTNKWASTIRIKGKKTWLGTFNTELEAHNAYINALGRI